ncbi:hypothetical protein BC829DRAFT_118171 [Chytridium lagenaria]|nr:hypothetical protein BC829DRAFT_118171 [Chytridium lagenaria]
MDGGQPGNDDDMDMIEPASPMMELDETIDYSLVYALHTFVANLEGQVCVLKGDSLELLDDSNSYWWLVKCIKTDEIGYIPAENVETPFERLARLNKIRNVQLASINAQDAEEGDRIPPRTEEVSLFRRIMRFLRITTMIITRRRKAGNLRKRKRRKPWFRLQKRKQLHPLNRKECRA